MPRTAVGSSQAWLTSTVSITSSPRPWRIACTWAMSAAGSRLPILSLKTRWRRASTNASASSTSRAASPLASVQSTGKRVAYGTAEQRVHRQAEALSLCVEQRDLHRRLGEGVALHRRGQALHRDVDAGGIGAAEQWRDVGVDGALDALGALLAVGQAADGGGFADAGDAVAAQQAHDHECLAHHGRHRQLVGADGRQVDQHGVDRLDAGVRVHELEY